MNVNAAKEAARIYYNYEPDDRWDHVWSGLLQPERSVWYDIAKAVESFCGSETATEQNNSGAVDPSADNAAAILRLQNEVEGLKRRLSAAEAWTKPIGDAKMGVQDLVSNAQRAGKVIGTIVKGI